MQQHNCLRFKDQCFIRNKMMCGCNPTPEQSVALRWSRISQSNWGMKPHLSLLLQQTSSRFTLQAHTLLQRKGGWGEGVKEEGLGVTSHTNVVIDQKVMDTWPVDTRIHPFKRWGKKWRWAQINNAMGEDVAREMLIKWMNERVRVRMTPMSIQEVLGENRGKERKKKGQNPHILAQVIREAVRNLEKLLLLPWTHVLYDKPTRALRLWVHSPLSPSPPAPTETSLSPSQPPFGRKWQHGSFFFHSCL